MSERVVMSSRGLLVAVCAVGLSTAPALGEPYLAVRSVQQWQQALWGVPPHVMPLSQWEWEEYWQQWQMHTQQGEPYPPTQFWPAELHVYGGGGGGGGGYPEEFGLVMLWGNDPTLPPGEYASAWKYDYVTDPDLSNAVITTSIFAPQWRPNGQITQVSFGIRDVLGRIRSWYWNVGPAGKIPWNVLTLITIDASQLGVNATTPPADAFLNTPGFDITQAQFFIADENAQWVGGPLPIPPPGSPTDGLWNLWHDITVRPRFDYKWSQPPDPAHPTNVYYGWNERSDWWNGPVVADDWICNSPDPVTHVTWWGSFLGWNYGHAPQLPQHFHIGFWTDVQGPPFSHPDIQWHEVVSSTYQCNFAGWDYDPRTGGYEACFRFDLNIPAGQYFYQDPGMHIFWVSIAACEGGGPPLPYPFGWKTRPQQPLGVPTDDAVRIWDPIQPMPGMQYVNGDPIWWPTERDSWDMAFELTTGAATYKWDQPPDLSPDGMDVYTNWHNGPILADDFYCSQDGPITTIRIWGSWQWDMKDDFPTFLLSIHDDIPAGVYAPWSMPGNTLWLKSFPPGTYSTQQYAGGLQEGFLWPPFDYWWPGDSICWLYEFRIPTAQAFYQLAGNIYWLDVQVMPQIDVSPGWKTSIMHWNDDAVWAWGQDPTPVPGPWEELRHPWTGNSLDLAFQIEGGGEQGTKWSQPPMPYTPRNAFNGWDQYSVYGSQIAADDWFCADDSPVTDIHWWGSFIGWNYPWPPLPEAFDITIWDDVPSNPSDPSSFSHPGTVLRQIRCTNYQWGFAGWDFDPRTIDGMEMPPEATFEFVQYLNESEWFWQEPGPHIYWVSIAAVYPTGQTVEYPFGWKTRPRNPDSLAPDDAVWISDPAAPFVGAVWGNGGPIYYPFPEDSWDLAFELTTRPQPRRDVVVCEPQGVVNNPFHPPTYWYDVTPGGGTGRCDFHVRVQDPNAANYTNIVAPTGWSFSVHPGAIIGEYWASWWDPSCTNPIFGTFRFQFDNPNPSTWDAWTTTISGTDDPYNQIVDQSANHSGERDGWGYRVHVPLRAPVRDRVVCEPQMPPLMHPPTYWYDVTPGGTFARCDFHVRVFDPIRANYTNVVSPPTWTFTVHQLANGEWWASWWDPDCDNPIWPPFTFRFQFDNPSASTWGDWTTTISSTDDPYNQVVDQSANHSGERDGWGYRVHVPRFEEYVKWSQPPTQNPLYPGFFYGWNEPSIYHGPQVAADDWRCIDRRAISDIHWWGSYRNWEAAVEPPDAPYGFHIGLWTNVPKGPDGLWSHPGQMLREWFVRRPDFSERVVGMDFHPEYGYETCFLYDLYLPRDEWFVQFPHTLNVFWLSISALYNNPCNADFDGDGDVDADDQNAFVACVTGPPGPECWRADLNWDGVVDLNDLPIFECQLSVGWPDPGCCVGLPVEPQHPWGWKTRRPEWNDDAVRIFAFLPPRIVMPFESGAPIENSEGSWDLAFVLTAPEPPPPVCPGDCNCDGVIDFDDINPFVAALVGLEPGWQAYLTRIQGFPPPCSFWNCDADQNGVVNFDDINPFVRLLVLGSPCP